MRRRAVAGLALAVLAGAGCRATRVEPVEFRVPVKVDPVKTGDVEATVVGTGTLRPPQKVVLRAETAGRIEVGRDASGRRLAEGDRVEAGQVIGSITGEDVDVAARLEATRERLETARADLESKRRLHEAGLISDLELKQAEAAFQDAEAEWKRSRLTVDRAVLRTPISGVILTLCRDEQGHPYADGQRVSAGYVFAEIAPDDSLVADVDLVGTDAARVRRGMPARIRTVAFPDRQFEGRVVRIAPSLDPVTRTLRVEISVRNDERLLKPGMFVEATIVLERHEGVPVVPRAAVVERSGRKVVFVLKGQRVVQRPVRLGLGGDEVVEIREGVAPGEKIVVAGVETLSDGSLVRVSGG